VNERRWTNMKHFRARNRIVLDFQYTMIGVLAWMSIIEVRKCFRVSALAKIAVSISLKTFKSKVRLAIAQRNLTSCK